MKIQPFSRVLSIATFVLTAGIFVLDLLTPLSLAVSVLYAGVVLLSLWSPQRGRTVALAALCTLLTLAALFGPSPVAAAPLEVANAGLAVLTIWTVAILGLRRRRAEDATRALLRLSEVLNSTSEVDEMLDALTRETMALAATEAGRVDHAFGPGDGGRRPRHPRRRSAQRPSPRRVPDRLHLLLASSLDRIDGRERTLK